MNRSLPCAPITTAAQEGLGPGLRKTHLGNIQPRASVAYRFADAHDTVLRGGFGIFTMTQLGQLAFNITDIHVSDLRTELNTIGADGQPAYAFPAVFGPTRPISPAYDAANVNALARGTIVRPDLVGDPTAIDPASGALWNIAAFAPTPSGAGRVGNAGVGSLEGPGTFTIAAGVARSFALPRGLKARLEVTVTNLLNRINFAAPATDVTTPATFGKPTSVQTAENAGNRSGQLALRLAF